MDFGTATTWITGEYMHFEIHVEDASGKTALEILVPKIIDISQHTFRIHPYKGIGHIPKDLKSGSGAQNRMLLNQLPQLVKGYGKTFAGRPGYPAVLMFVCDLDHRCLSDFRRALLDCVNQCNPKPDTYFCIAIEEGEAWFLGDLTAVKTAYPGAKPAVLNAYVNDSICDTWEKLADAVFPGGSLKLSKLKGQIGKEKAMWAEKIPHHMDVDKNQSPSFCYFRDKLRGLSRP